MAELPDIRTGMRLNRVPARQWRNVMDSLRALLNMTTTGPLRLDKRPSGWVLRAEKAKQEPAAAAMAPESPDTEIYLPQACVVGSISNGLASYAAVRLTSDIAPDVYLFGLPPLGADVYFEMIGPAGAGAYLAPGVSASSITLYPPANEVPFPGIQRVPSSRVYPLKWVITSVKIHEDTPEREFFDGAAPSFWMYSNQEGGDEPRTRRWLIPLLGSRW